MSEGLSEGQGFIASQAQMRDGSASRVVIWSAPYRAVRSLGVDTEVWRAGYWSGDGQRRDNAIGKHTRLRHRSGSFSRIDTSEANRATW
jgi:hypothetical protein